MKTCSECQAEFQPTNNRQFACIDCKLSRELRIKKERRQKDPDARRRDREATARYRANNPERVRELERQRYWENPDSFRKKSNEYRKDRYKQDEEWRLKCLEYQKKYRLENNKRLNNLAREKYRNDEEYRQKCKKQAQQWSRANPESVIENRKKYYKENYERFAAYNLTRHSREPIDKKLVSEVYQEGNFTCVYCGQYGGKITIDHKIPVSRGGKNDKDNLCLACHRCNCRKGAKTVEEYTQYLEQLPC